ncbi:MAG TPA: hypothetical protein VLU96_03350 [Gaiellaceae bacterium]|nr:hypothetical protein [Gaiellaceae bacterium]
MKRILGLILAVTIAGAFAVASQARTAHHPRHGTLHVTKDCPQATYQGQAGGYCTIKSSNLGAIPAGSKVFYMEAAGSTGLDSDLVVYTGPGNIAIGHVTLSFTTLTGEIVFAGGTGQLSGFRARVAVSFDGALWHWDGPYSFGSSHDND